MASNQPSKPGSNETLRKYYNERNNATKISKEYLAIYFYSKYLLYPLGYILFLGGLTGVIMFTVRHHYISAVTLATATFINIFFLILIASVLKLLMKLIVNSEKSTEAIEKNTILLEKILAKNDTKE